MSNPTIADLEAALAAAKRAEADKAKALRDSTPIVWKFTVEPCDPNTSHDEIFDPTCRLYTVKGEVVNAAEAREAGHPDHMLNGGLMRYVYNMGTERIVSAVGGGTIYLGASWTSRGKKYPDSHLTAIAEVSAFLARNPEGGDITEIVERHRQRSGWE